MVWLRKNATRRKTPQPNRNQIQGAKVRLLECGAMSFHVPESGRDTTHPMLRTSVLDGNNGVFYLDSPEPGWQLALICSDGSEAPEIDDFQWEHVSVHAYREGGKKQRCPTWKEMCFVKRHCWDEDDIVVQYHPRETDYKNWHPFTLHLWRPKLQPVPTPPLILV
jgi:hypothetical protein